MVWIARNFQLYYYLQKDLTLNKYLFKWTPLFINKTMKSTNLEKENSNHSFYKEYYEKDYKSGFYNLDRSKGKWFSKYVKIKIIEGWIKKYPIKKETLLDAGGGTGTYAWHFMKDFNQVIVSDVSKTALDMIPEKEIKKVCCNILHHPLKSESIDCVLLIDVLEHLKEEDLFDLMKEMNRLLKKDGFIIIYSSLFGWTKNAIYHKLFHKGRRTFVREEIMGHLNRLTFKEYQRLFRKTGFRAKDYFYYSIIFQRLSDSVKDYSAIFLERFKSKINKKKNPGFNVVSEIRRGQEIKEVLREGNKNRVLIGMLYFFSWMSYLDILIFGKLFKGDSVFFLLKKK